jgi:transposase
MSARKTYRKVTKEFKQEAIRLSEQPDRTVSQVAAELGIPVNTLYRWRKESVVEGPDAFRGRGRLRTAEAELAALRRENEVLRMERDILKKAAAWFAKEQL